MISIVKRSECQSGRNDISFITTGNERRHRRPDILDDELIHSLKRYQCGVRSLTKM